MNTLRPGSKGSFVKKWQMFLRGLSEDSLVVVNGEFDEVTLTETKRFQETSNLVADGIIGPRTLSTAISLGFDVVKDSSVDESGPNWPPRPPHGPLMVSERVRMFGRFSFEPAPTKNNPEGIKLTDDWSKKNITSIQVASLSGLPGSSANGTVHIHQAVSKQFLQMFDDWTSAGLSEKILTWGGMWVPRFIRGSRTSLSNHSWGTAFDINVAWNGLGIRPALKDEKGSVRELVDIAYKNGFYWGGWFPSRPDGMHFEAYKIIT